jgi:hypothetical protein
LINSSVIIAIVFILVKKTITYIWQVNISFFIIFTDGDFEMMVLYYV